MMAHELQAGTRFHVVGLSETWEVVRVGTSRVVVQFVVPETRHFRTLEGDEVRITFRRKAFYISRETSVEVDK